MVKSLEGVAGRIAGSIDDLVALTCDLVRFPTINPPGEAYTPCAEYIGKRLAAAGFEISYVRGEGTPGDSNRYPRTNVIARREGGRPGPTSSASAGSSPTAAAASTGSIA